MQNEKQYGVTAVLSSPLTEQKTSKTYTAFTTPQTSQFPISAKITENLPLRTSYVNNSRRVDFVPHLLRTLVVFTANFVLISERSTFTSICRYRYLIVDFIYPDRQNTHFRGGGEFAPVKKYDYREMKNNIKRVGNETYLLFENNYR